MNGVRCIITPMHRRAFLGSLACAGLAARCRSRADGDAIVLGDNAESSFRQAMLVSQGDMVGGR